MSETQSSNINDSCIPSWGIYEDSPHLQIYEDQVIGHGSNGFVVKVKYIETFFAAKTLFFLHNPALRALLSYDEKNAVVKELQEEINILSSVGYFPHIVPLFRVVFDKQKVPVWILSEYVEGGSLASLIHSHPDGLPPVKVLEVSIDILKGLSFLHIDLKGVHRDIKPANILISINGTCKICDFGTCKLNSLLSQSLKGTPLYMAPEILKPPYTPAVDIWSFGVMFVELILGEFGRDVDVFQPSNHGVKAQDKIPHFKIVVTSTLVHDPQDRLSAIELLKLIEHIHENLQPTTPTTTTTRASTIPMAATMESQGASFLYPNRMLKYSQQVEMASKAALDKINVKEFSELLHGVTEGDLKKVQNLLMKMSILSLGTGSVTDRSGRTFKNITALQYAAWALDVEMCDLIVGHLDPYNSLIQLNALMEEPNCYSIYGTNYDVTSLISKARMYLSNYSNWDYVGGEQRKCPAWLIYTWSEEGTDVAWTKKDVNQKFERKQYHLDWWFTALYNNGKGVGSSWAIIRGENSCLLVRTPMLTWLSYIDNYIPLYHLNSFCQAVEQDYCFLEEWVKHCNNKLQQLRIDAETKATREPFTKFKEFDINNVD